MACRILFNPRIYVLPFASLTGVIQIDNVGLNLYETTDMKEADTSIRLRDAMFPSETYGGRLVSTWNTGLSVEGMPGQPYFQPALAGPPKPDLSYGYHKNAFSPSEALLQQASVLNPYALSTTECYWPFFHIEFEPQAHSGKHWMAEHQNAISGGHSVKSMERLLEYAQCNPERHHQVHDSVAFSCCIDSDCATLWIHWVDQSHDDKEGNAPHYVSSYLGRYVFRDTTQLRDFLDHTHNIIEYGMNQRLTKIKQALSDIMLFDPEWTTRMSLSSRRRRRSVGRDSSDSDVTSSQPF